MSNYCVFIYVKCNSHYTDQLSSTTMLSKWIGKCGAYIQSVYKCYGDYDFIIALKPTPNAIFTANECGQVFRKQPWVETTSTTFGEECFTSMATEAST